MLEFRILGPLHVLDDDRTIELGGARQRAVLAILLLHRGETVSVDRIVDLMWGERPPVTAVKTVQVYVSHLRRALVDEVLVSSRGGYALGVDAERIDACASSGSSRKVAQRSPATIPRVRRSSSEPGWRCGAGRRSPTSPTRGSCRTRPCGSRSGVSKRSRSASRPISRLGRHAELVAELEGLVREHPLRERLRAQHMLALYRSGRQADALASFRDARRSLVDELGIEPGRELRELEQAILAQDPALDRRARAALRGRRPLVAAASRSSPRAQLLAAAVGAVAMALSVRAASVAVLPDSVAVIDPESGLVVADVPGRRPPGGGRGRRRSVWVANVADGTVPQIDIDKRRVVATFAPDVGVDALAVGAGSAWIADARRGGPCAWTLSSGRSRIRYVCPHDEDGTPIRHAARGGARPRFALGGEHAARRSPERRHPDESA